MSADFVTAHRAFLTLAFLTAIPVVILALWAEYTKKAWDDEKELTDTPEMRNEQIRQVRWGGFAGFLTQIFVFFSNHEARAEHPGWCAFLLIMALFAQNTIQYGLEKRLRELKESPVEHARIGLKSFFWTMASLAGYLGVIGLFVGAATAVGLTFKFPPAAFALILFGGGILGITCALALTFALGPIYLKQLFSTKPIVDPEIQGILKECFSRGKVPEPEFLTIELEHFGAHNALVAGYKSGRGVFRPAVFITPSLIKNLTPEEFRAVIFHEVSHLSLNHMRRRFLSTTGALFGSVLAASILLVTAHLLFPAPLTDLVRFICLFIPVLVPLSHLKKQMDRQEDEADLHAIATMGASFDDFSTALRKLDLMNDQLLYTDQIVPIRKTPSVGHPETEARLKRLRIGIERLRLMRRSAQARKRQPKTKSVA